jgi:putative flippase GtrA
LSRLWTWKDAPKKQGKGLFIQFISFNLAVLTGIIIRTITFGFFELFGVNYVFNVVIGIGLAATVDLILYDKFVFRRQGNEKQPL